MIWFQIKIFNLRYYRSTLQCPVKLFRFDWVFFFDKAVCAPLFPYILIISIWFDISFRFSMYFVIAIF